jgi:hypothetical protein
MVAVGKSATPFRKIGTEARFGSFLVPRKAVDVGELSCQIGR